MSTDYREILEFLGYDMKKKGAVFFIDLIGDVRELLEEGKSEEEIKKLLPRYYLEYYHFCYEIGRKKYMIHLEEFCKSKKSNRKNRKVNIKQNMSIEDLLIFIAKYVEKEEDKKKNKVLIYVNPLTGNGTNSCSM